MANEKAVEEELAKLRAVTRQAEFHLDEIQKMKADIEKTKKLLKEKLEEANKEKETEVEEGEIVDEPSPKTSRPLMSAGNNRFPYAAGPSSSRSRSRSASRNRSFSRSRSVSQSGSRCEHGQKAYRDNTYKWSNRRNYTFQPPRRDAERRTAERESHREKSDREADRSGGDKKKDDKGEGKVVSGGKSGQGKGGEEKRGGGKGGDGKGGGGKGGDGKGGAGKGGGGKGDGKGMKYYITFN